MSINILATQLTLNLKLNQNKAGNEMCGCMQAYGNAALALLLCVGSNTIGIATIPFFLEAMLSSATDVDLDPVDLLVKLVIGILVPLSIGKLLLNIPAVQRFTKNHKTLLKLLNNGSLIMVLWQSISRAQVCLTLSPFQSEWPCQPDCAPTWCTQENQCK